MRVDTDAIDMGDLNSVQLEATLRDFRELVARVGDLYGLDWRAVDSAPVQTADLFISFCR